MFALTRKVSIAFIFCLLCSNLIAKNSNKNIESIIQRAVDENDNFFDSQQEDIKPKLVRVSIPLQITAYKPLKSSKAMSSSEVRVRGTQRYLLKSRLHNIDDYYVSKLHIQTIPIKFDRDKRLYKLKVVIFKRYDKGVEEKIGDLKIQGSLVDKGGSFSLKGLSSKTFRDKWGHKSWKVVAGLGSRDTSSKLSKEAEHQIGVRRRL